MRHGVEDECGIGSNASGASEDIGDFDHNAQPRGMSHHSRGGVVCLPGHEHYLLSTEFCLDARVILQEKR